MIRKVLVALVAGLTVIGTTSWPAETQAQTERPTVNSGFPETGREAELRRQLQTAKQLEEEAGRIDNAARWIEAETAEIQREGRSIRQEVDRLTLKDKKLRDYVRNWRCPNGLTREECLRQPPICYSALRNLQARTNAMQFDIREEAERLARRVRVVRNRDNRLRSVVSDTEYRAKVWEQQRDAFTADVDRLQ